MRIARIKKTVMAALLGASLCAGVANAGIQENKFIADILVGVWGPMILLTDATNTDCNFGLMSVPSGQQPGGAFHSTFMAILIGAKLSKTPVTVSYTVVTPGSCLINQLDLMQ